MTKQQQRAVIKLIAKDCQIEDLCLDGNKTCAVGCLALAAGVSRDELLAHNALEIGLSQMEEIRDAIFSKFGLGKWDLKRIQVANDSNWKTAAKRRAAVIKEIKKL